MRFLVALGQDVEIVVKPKKRGGAASCVWRRHRETANITNGPSQPLVDH